MLYLSSNITKRRLYVIFCKAFKYPNLKEQGSETLSGHRTHPNSPKNKLHKKFRMECDFLSAIPKRP